MAWMVTYFSFFIVFCVGFGHGAKFLLTVPKKPHFDTQYTVTVSAFEIFERQYLSLEYRGVRDKSKLLNSTTLIFEFDGIRTWTVEFPWTTMEKLQESAVTLTMSTDYSEAKKTLYFSKATGFIFIQTDKPLYTPRQTVKFRIIAVDEYQRLAKYPLKVDIRNDKLIIVDRLRYSAEDAFKGQEFELPKETQPGNWTISANFEATNNIQGTAHTVSFEVREYVLPRFSAFLTSSQDVITKTTNWITVTVKAKYVYGADVMGTLEMQLGIWDPQTGVHLLPDKYYGNLTHGSFKLDIRVSKLIPPEMFERANRRLYINVNVTELGTGENDTVIDTSTFIAHPYYEITYANSKSHFKPGFNYTLHTQVRAQSGRPAKWLKLWISLHAMDEDNKIVGMNFGYFDLDDEGKTLRDFKIPKAAHTIKFKTIVLDFKAGTDNDNEWIVPVLESPNKQYVQISLLKPIKNNSNFFTFLNGKPVFIALRHMKKYSDGLVKLQYTKPSSNTVTRITIMVLARGHIVFSNSVVRSTDGRSLVPIPKHLYTETSPSMRIVASFHHSGEKGKEFVIDSLLVDTDQVCVEELSLHRPGGAFATPLPKKPKEKYNLQIRGGPAMHVGLVAVDSAVFLLNDAHTLTRNSVFQQLASHDQGIGSGDGVDLEEVMKNSGLIHMIIDTAKAHVEEASYEELFAHGDGLFGVRGKRLDGVVSKKDDGIVSRDFIAGAYKRTGTGPSIIQPPPQTVRKYFPESWLFEEHILPKTGHMKMNLTLPDSITTWSFMAVGLSSTRGVCVSRQLTQKVQKMFFVDVRLPYKVTRLEEVKVKIAVYNYHTDPISINVIASGSGGLCFSSNRIRGTQQNTTSFSMTIPKKNTRSRVIKVIPLDNGDLTLRIDAFNIFERDIVERQINVVAEGLKLRKSLTFVLDPQGRHATFPKKKQFKLVLADTSTLKNVINRKEDVQKTEIDLAMPKEVIRGTENCKISAFGDLMGDIIDHAVMKSKSLMDQSVNDAEEVIGDLGPTVHALLYANKSGLMNDVMSKRSRRFVTHGVARLLKFRKDPAFSLTTTSPEGTWLTATILKTLCHASSLAFIDKDILIDHGFFWLFDQITENETLTERDYRLSKDSWDYRVMLSAEVLIAILECDRQERELHASLMFSMAFLLEDNLEKIKDPMVLAKMVYGLSLFERDSEETQRAVKKLAAVKRTNREGQIYWSSEKVTEERKNVPFWYRKGVKASAIEATAFALLVFLRHPGPNTDAIADWLISQRNNHGTFVGALDSMAAIQALSFYSQAKGRHKVNLSCNITLDKAQKHSHSFKFTEKNAMRPESLTNLPVGHTMEVLTKGQGLGQMQVNVEYNIPIDPNEKCTFNVTVEVKRTEVNYFPNMLPDPLCVSCSWGCRLKEVNLTDAGNDTVTNTTDSMNVTTTPNPPTPIPHRMHSRILFPNTDAGLSSSDSRRRVPYARSRSPPRPRSSYERRRSTLKLSGRRMTSRKSRSIRQHSSASRNSICMRVCLKHLDDGPAGRTKIEIDMLTGYEPVALDVEVLKKQSGVLEALFDTERDTLIVVFRQISDEEETCFAFRAVDQEEVGRPTPATVLVTEIGNPAPSCALEYHSPSKTESLQVYCADFAHSNRGECRCYSGLCSTCAPVTRNDEIGLSAIKKHVCKSDVGYQLQMTNVRDRDQWVEIDAKVMAVNKTGSHDVKPNQTIRMMSPSSCACPTFIGSNEPLYMISADVEKMVDRYGNIVHHYLLDEQSVFLRVADPVRPKSAPSNAHLKRLPPPVPHIILQKAFKTCTP